MALQGNLKDMSVADIIQHNCQDRKTAQVVLHNGDQNAALYFKDGHVVHATSDGIEGEEIIFQILAWNEGTFNLESGIEAPSESITRSWTGLLMEGARLLDESELEQPEKMEVNPMAQKMDEVLKELSGEVAGYMASVVVGMDGLSIAEHTKTAKIHPETTSAQMAMLLKLVDTSTSKLGAGSLEDDLLTTENAHVLMCYLPKKEYFLGIAVDRKNGNLGNLRLMSKLYTDRIVKAMPS